MEILALRKPVGGEGRGGDGCSGKGFDPTVSFLIGPKKQLETKQLKTKPHLGPAGLILSKQQSLSKQQLFLGQRETGT